ncbi:MAG: acetolactate synthase large subunit [bacterium]|nr:acetolactate synthase large subunit [bacterium]
MNNKENKNVGEVFVECLEAEGVKYIFGVAGEENLMFLEAVRKSTITFIPTRHEQAAVFMAATIGRLTGKVGVALSTLGPGATNLMTGVAYAQLGGMPLLVITGQKPIKKTKQGKFQIIDVVAMMRPVTKYSETIVSSDRVPAMVRSAISIAESERPGAVHLELPEDIAEEMCEGQPVEPYKIRRPVADDKSITIALNEIEKSKKPIIVVASGGNRKLIRKQLQIFIDRSGIPFVCTQMGKGVIDETSPLYIGTTSLSKGDYVHQALRVADLVIMIGHDTSEKPPILLTPRFCKVIHINFYPASIDNVYIPTHEVIGDISHTLWVFGEKVKITPDWDFNYFFKVRDILKEDIQSSSNAEDFPLRPERVVADLRKAMPDDGILALDNGMYKIWIARNYDSRVQNGVLLDNALATMGAGLPSGIATKMLYPGKKVVVVAGDGGIMMCLGDLETAVRLGIDLTILILNDNGFGMIRWHVAEMNIPEHGLSFSNPDFVLLARSFGATGYEVKSADELQPTLQKALSNKGVNIISCPISYKEANEVLASIKDKKIL